MAPEVSCGWVWGSSPRLGLEGGVTGTHGATHVITLQTGMRDRTVGMSLSASGLCDRQ